MRSVAELATQLREFWLRDLGAGSTTYSSADSGSISLTNTLFIATTGGYVGINTLPESPYALDIIGDVRIAGNLLDRSGNSWSIGSEDNPWGAVYAADLHVGNLVAENKIATTSGRIIVSSSTKLTAAVAAADATIDVAANTLASGDRIYFETTGKLEWMAVTSGPTTISGGYRYSVTRNLNGAGAQTWKAGDAVVNTGTTGQGFIDLYSRYGIPASGETSTTRVGPTIVGNVRTSSTYNDISERWAIGNLNGLYGYSATTYGFAAGDYASSWLSADATNGLRMMYASAVRMRLSTAGNLFINDSDGNAVFTFDNALGAEFTLPLTLGSAGGIYQGTGTFASPTTGLKIYNSSGIGLIAGYSAGVVQWYANTDGKLYAGAGNVKIDSNGITLNKGTGYAAASAIKWGGDDISVTGYYSLATNRLFLLSQQLSAGAYAQSNLQASGGTSGGGIGQVYIIATGNGTSASLTVQSNTGISIVGAVGITGNMTHAGTVTVVGQSDTNQLIVKGHSTQTAAQIVIQSSAGAEWLSIRGLANGSVIIGQDAAPNLTSADTVAIGYRAMNGVTSSNSIGIGTQALENMSASGHSNIGIGYWAGKNLTDGLYNVLIGEGAGYSITTSINNFMLGTNTGWNLDGSDNIGIGSFAMYYSTTATDSVVIGSGAGFHTDGLGNVVIGSGAGDVAAGGCVFIGYQAGRSESNPNTLHISNTDTATPLIYGDFSTPALTFNGTVTIADGYNMVFGGSTGTKLGSAASEKIGVWGLTPVVQPTTGVAAASFTANSGTTINDASTFDGYTIRQVVRALRNIGWLA